MKNIHQKVLLVEGAEDKRIIPELIEANGIDWEIEKGNYIVHIDPNGGYEKIIAPGVISTRLQVSGLKSLGIIVDADEEPENRWQSLRNACLESVSDLPLALPKEGLIHNTEEGIKFGIWIMPDNQLQGMLETFLSYLIRDDSDALWQLAQDVTQTAKQQNAPFKNTHLDKAHIYTWLAWQNPPGRQLHDAIKQRILDPKHPEAQRFVSWFRTLYDLTE